ncbi:MAG: VOC family protein [Pseudomonadota bacterium]
MTDRLLDIDHLMINVPNAQSAGEAFEAMGFTVTPLSGMPGLENRLVCFSDTDAAGGVCNYIELMGLTDPSIAPPPMPTLLSRPFGPISTVLCADDVKAARERLVEGGMALGPALDLQRDWHLPSGETITPAFAVAIPDLDQSPFYWNYCQHKTPQHYVRDDFTGHSNGITRLTAVLAVHDAPLEAAAHYESVWPANKTGVDPVILTLGTVDLEIFSPGMFAEQFGVTPPRPGLVGMRLETDKLSETRDVMTKAGVETHALKNGFLVAPTDAANAVLVVEAKA